MKLPTGSTAVVEIEKLRDDRLTTQHPGGRCIKILLTELTDKSRLAAVKERDIDYSDIPELSDDWFAKALKGAHIPEKRPVSLRLDDDVVDFFKSEGSRYQTRINAVLRAYMENRKKAHG